MSMTITDCRTYLLTTARNGGDSSMYTAVVQDVAIQGIVNDFIGRTQCTRTTGDLSLAAGSSVLPSFGSPAAGSLTGFRPEYLLRAYLTNAPTLTGEPPKLGITDYLTILDYLNNAPQTGQPTLIGFETASTGGVYPTTDKAYNLRLLWTPPCPSWAAGTTDSTTLSTTVINVPDEYLMQVIRWGGVVYLQGNEPQNKAALADNWNKYLDFVERAKSRGLGTSGKQVSFRTAPPGQRGITGVRYVKPAQY